MWLYQWFPLCGTMSNPPSQKYVTSIQKNNVRCQVHNSPQVPATNLLTSIGFCLRSWTLGIIFVSHATTMEVSFWFAASVVHHARRGSCLSLSLSLSLSVCASSVVLCPPVLGDDMQNLSLSLSVSRASTCSAQTVSTFCSSISWCRQLTHFIAGTQVGHS